MPFLRCGQGRDRAKDNLAISVAEPHKYLCWAGCTKDQIRAALGAPGISDKFAIREMRWISRLVWFCQRQCFEKWMQPESIVRLG
jgi:hypothetical protein